MPDVDEAIAQIADIRDRMAASTRFRGYAPGAVGTIGLLALAVTLLQLARPAQFAGSDRQIVIIWGALMGAGLFLIAFEAVLRTRRENDRIAHSMLLAAMRIVLPGTVLTAAVPAAVLIYAPTAAWIVPGIWQMLIGVVAFASYPSLPRTIIAAATWFMGAGVIGLFVAGHQGGLSPLIVGGPFIVGHFAIAWTLMNNEGATRAKR